jgi:hypothetical protein
MPKIEPALTDGARAGHATAADALHGGQSRPRDRMAFEVELTRDDGDRSGAIADQPGVPVADRVAAGDVDGAAPRQRGQADNGNEAKLNRAQMHRPPRSPQGAVESNVGKTSLSTEIPT